MGPQDEASVDWLNEILEHLRYGQDYDIVDAEYNQSPGVLEVKREYVKLYSTGIEKLHKMLVRKNKLIAQMQIECIDPAIDDDFGTVDYDKVAELTLNFINSGLKGSGTAPKYAAIESYITENYGPRCKIKDTEDFPELADEPEESRCAGCRAWEDYDEWCAEKKIEVS